MKNKNYKKIIFIIIGIMVISAASIILIKSAADGRDLKKSLEKMKGFVM